jgi:hypothetical protein
LEADLDLSRLAALLPDLLRLFKPARIRLTATVEQNNLRMTARVIYPEPIPWNSVQWQLPKDLVQGPVISFTAAQNVAAFLNLSPAFSQLEGDPLTNQFCSWASEDMVFLNYMAWPVVNATNVLEKFSIAASDTFGPALQKFNGTELRWLAEQRKLILANLRVMVPSLEAVQDKAGEFLLLSLFPLHPSKESAPDDLWNQIDGRTNLVYYDRETTSPRLQQWGMVGRMLLTRSGPPKAYVMRARAITDTWFGALSALVGNTTTEITRVAPNELYIVRTGPFGLTGIEIFLLSDCLSTLGPPPINLQPPPH